ncbi:uncharacterized protein B0T23DRAFT_115653 [Neurospora hispaniola]|uniref:Uncharacterized protein n=1 Tax=Neurospora hispaniola TaxID=588809 RepID=A0AAJ0IA36_9PEZI|nr:hypothetical protein B0T23DRAFT_115653 [Neurospora hispaniola]
MMPGWTARWHVSRVACFTVSLRLLSAFSFRYLRFFLRFMARQFLSRSSAPPPLCTASRPNVTGALLPSFIRDCSFVGVLDQSWTFFGKVLSLHPRGGTAHFGFFVNTDQHPTIHKRQHTPTPNEALCSRVGQNRDRVGEVFLPHI